MATDYGNFYCRVCGGQVFVPLSEEVLPERDGREAFELTCFNGHTDRYDWGAVYRESDGSEPLTFKMKSAVAAGG